MLTYSLNPYLVALDLTIHNKQLVALALSIHNKQLVALALSIHNKQNGHIFCQCTGKFPLHTVLEDLGVFHDDLEIQFRVMTRMHRPFSFLEHETGVRLANQMHRRLCDDIVTQTDLVFHPDCSPDTVGGNRPDGPPVPCLFSCPL